MITIPLQRVVLAVIFFLVAAYAMAIERDFPEGTKRGRLSTTELGELIVNNKLIHILPSLRIFNEEGLIVNSASVYANNVMINYLLNDYGEVERIWILSEEEARRPLVIKR